MTPSPRLEITRDNPRLPEARQGRRGHLPRARRERAPRGGAVAALRGCDAGRRVRPSRWSREVAESSAPPLDVDGLSSPPALGRPSRGRYCVHAHRCATGATPPPQPPRRPSSRAAPTSFSSASGSTSAPAFDRGANNAETPQQPPRKVLCDAENGCRERRLFTPSAVNRLPAPRARRPAAARRGRAGGALVQGAAAVRLSRNQPTGGGAEGRGRLSGRPRSSRRSPTLDCRRERSDLCRGMRQRPAICCAARVLRCRGRGA